jgi:hypothetical protein
VTPTIFNIVAGESLSCRVTVQTDGDGNSVVSLAGYTVAVAVYDSLKPTVELTALRRSSESGTIIIAGNIATWTWLAEDCDTLPKRSFFRVILTHETITAKSVAEGIIRKA